MSNESDQPEDEDVRILVGAESDPGDYVGFFEDDGETGYLYVSDRKEHRIIQHLQIYINSLQLGVEEEDVMVVWSTEGKKCGVAIWGAIRGAIDLANKREGRVFVESRSTPPIDDPEWLRGFE